MRVTDETLAWFDQIRTDERERCVQVVLRYADRLGIHRDVGQQIIDAIRNPPK